MNKNKTCKFAVIGTGFAGIAAAVRLRQEGEEDILMFERGSDVGGVWRDNRYPGCACDVESHLYSLSFAPNPSWSMKFSPQPEIYAYLRDCVKEYRLIDYIRFNHEVKRMDWDEENGEWVIQTNHGDFRATYVIGAFGALSNPSIPMLKGIEHFKGEVFHSANWPIDFNAKGKRIAVIGTGASAIQFIPEIQPESEFLHVFQRTPAWVVPRLDAPISHRMQTVYKRFPLLQKMRRLTIYLQRELSALWLIYPKWLKFVEKIAIKHLNETIKDPELREKLTPRYRMGCKRILLSNTYYPALAKENVDVNTNGIKEVTADGMIDSKGNEIMVDAIIFGTGFQVPDLPFANYIYGKSGHSLSEEWKGSPKAYLGTTVSGFPNLFLLQGPNTGLGHSSVLIMIEAQINHMIKSLRYIKQHNIKVIEPTVLALERFVAQTDKKMEGTVWISGGCKSWYLDNTGRNSTIWPDFTFKYRKQAAKFKKQDYLYSKK
ncbi:NAD(P)/FAD-dependent oxidoreductase [Cytobacillus suaedae]|nr:NAD(P)/FAD-dependent oxidoreductase [Cytobacillus suaedae]